MFDISQSVEGQLFAKSLVIGLPDFKPLSSLLDKIQNEQNLCGRVSWCTSHGEVVYGVELKDLV